MVLGVGLFGVCYRASLIPSQIRWWWLWCSKMSGWRYWIPISVLGLHGLTARNTQFSILRPFSYKIRSPIFVSKLAAIHTQHPLSAIQSVLWIWILVPFLILETMSIHRLLSPLQAEQLFNSDSPIYIYSILKTALPFILTWCFSSMYLLKWRSLFVFVLPHSHKTDEGIWHESYIDSVCIEVWLER